MRHILLFQGDCAACSELARTVEELSVPELEVAPIRDPRVAEVLSTANLELPARPALVLVNDGNVRILHGWSMGWRLASLVGWSHSKTLARLLAAEHKARIARAAEPAAGATRRGVVVATVSGIAGVVGIGLLPRSASAATNAAEIGVAPAAKSDVARALKSQPVRKAVQTWGAHRADIVEVRKGTQRVLVLTHEDSDVFTFVDNSADARGAEKPASFTLGKMPGSQRGLRYYSTAGTPLCDLTLDSSGSPVVTAVTAPPGTVQPDFSVQCFIYCLGSSVSATCAISCLNCAFGSWVAKLTACPYCAYCAGPDGVKCAKQCS